MLQGKLPEDVYFVVLIDDLQKKNGCLKNNIMSDLFYKTQNLLYKY